MNSEEMCPCGSGKTYGQCCGPVISGEVKAETAEALMRARYSAYAAHEVAFLKTSAGKEAQAEFNEEASRQWAEKSTWQGLEILSTEGGGAGDEEGMVEFVAHYSAGGETVRHHEHSQFRRIDGEWKFIDGEIESPTYRREQPKIGRNDPCPCGSGLKYKKCCGRGKA